MASETSERVHSVSVVIPTWKRDDLLRKCLESLRRQTFADFEVVIVSNGAGEWAEKLAREFGCKLVRFPENRGFAAAVNAGITASESQYVVVLNDDAELDPAWLEKAVAVLEEQSGISFCCGKIYTVARNDIEGGGGRIDDVGDAISMAGAAWRLGHGRVDPPEFNQARPLFAVSMTAALFRRAVFETIGNLDENFISYLEDMDYSIRLWRAGLRGVYVPQAVARHHGGSSLGGESLDGQNSRQRFGLMTQNQMALLAKHYPGTLWLRLAARIAWAQILWFAMAVRRGLLGAYLAGVWQCFCLLPECNRKRTPWSKDERRAFLNWLRESERVIYEDISARPRAEQDTYWRMYFALFRPRGASGVAGVSSVPGEVEEKQKADPSSSRRAGTHSR
ncbi:MAG: glycosyltransferase family 2 protein [Acidobacteria bacterium]|nr:glycosyltransferase family 2 protein [Acidobacteriota bacterium]